MAVSADVGMVGVVFMSIISVAVVFYGGERDGGSGFRLRRCGSAPLDVRPPNRLLNNGVSLEER